MEERQIAYDYNGTIKPEETDIDFEVFMRIPSEGEVLVRPGGKQWKVMQVVVRYHEGNPLPTYVST
jgi:hypothetical protein